MLLTTVLIECEEEGIFFAFLLRGLYYFFKKIFIYLCAWLRRVLVVARRIFPEACGIFRCGSQALCCGTRASL